MGIPAAYLGMRQLEADRSGEAPVAFGGLQIGDWCSIDSQISFSSPWLAVADTVIIDVTKLPQSTVIFQSSPHLRRRRQ